MATVRLNVNGRTHTVDVEPATPLLYVLRNDLELHGPRFGCGLSQCGACTVLVQGRPVRSCVTPVSSVKASDQITTLEGLGTPDKPHPVQQAWIEIQAMHYKGTRKNTLDVRQCASVANLQSLARMKQAA